MFHFRRRKQESYWFLSATGPGDADDCTIPGQISCKHDDASLVGASDFRKWEKPSLNPVPATTLGHALALQESYTSWPSSIWEISFDDADGEIVFDDGNNNVENDDDAPSFNNSVETEGTLHSSCYSPPEHQISCELFHDLVDFELSDIVEEDVEDEEEERKGFDLEIPNGCALLGHRAGVKKDSEEVAEEDNDSGSHCDLNIVRIQEYFDPQGPFQPQVTPNSLPKKPSGHKRLRFADEEGKTIETIHFVDHHDQDDDTSLRRVLILMLLPKQKKFEFVHAQYDIESQLAVSALLKQLPDLASDSLIKKQKYRRLCTAKGGIELINALSLQSYDLPSDEVLLAVSNGYSSEDLHKMARTLFDNEKILRAVKRTHKAAHTLHTLESKEVNYNCLRKKTHRKPKEKGSNNQATGKQVEVTAPLDQDSGCTTLHQSSLSIKPQMIPNHNPSSNDVASLKNKPGSTSCGDVASNNDGNERVDWLQGTRSPEKLEVVPHMHEQVSPVSIREGTVMANLHECTPDPKKQKRANYFERKLQQKLSPTSVLEPPSEERISFFGNKMFQRNPSPRKGAGAVSPSEAKGMFKKSFFKRLPSPRRIQVPARAEAAEGEEGYHLGKVFQRRPSPRRVDQNPGQSEGQYMSGKNVLQRKQSSSRTRTSTPRNDGSRARVTNLPKTGWGKFRTMGSSINNNKMDVKQ